MINLTDNAKKHLDNYLQQVRTCLKDCPTVDADEVEQNIKEHIESELQGSLEPVSFDALDDILLFADSAALETMKLAYLSFGLLVVGFMLSRLLLPLLILASFIVSRAALSANNYRIEVKAQKWLIYPSLIIVYLVLLCFFLGLPLLGLIPLAYDWEHTIRATYKIGDDTPYWLAACSVFVALIGLWWLIHGVVFLARPNIPKVLFRPFADGFNRRWALVLLCVGFALLVFSLASLYLVYGRYFQPI